MSNAQVQFLRDGVVLFSGHRIGKDNSSMSWTDERVDQLKKLWLDGLSASQIAQELGGVTRNAVIGKVHRLGLSGRAKTASHTAIARQKRANGSAFNQKPVRTIQRQLVNGQMKLVSPAERTNAAAAADLATAPTPLKLVLTELTERTCKWPVGDPQAEDFHFCGHDSREGSPYCAYHSKLAYQPVTDRRRDRRAEGAW